MTQQEEPVKFINMNFLSIIHACHVGRSAVNRMFCPSVCRCDSIELSLIQLSPRSYESEDKKMIGIKTAVLIMTLFPSVCYTG